MLFLIFACVLSLWIYFQIIKPLKYWEEKGIPYIKPWPIVGNLGPTTFRTLSFVELIEYMYNAYPDSRYVGIYQFMRPTLLIRDPELIKIIAVKEFNTFPNHREFSSEDADPLGSKNLFNLTNAKGWHDMRATLSPAFTSNKMRMIFNLMDQCANQLIDHLGSKRESETIEVKNMFSRITSDVIGSVAFGVTCDSLKNPDNEFYLMGKNLTNLRGFRLFKFFLYAISPTFVKFFRMTLFNKVCIEFYINLVQEALRVRKQNQIVRPDMMHLLLEARKGRLQHENQSNVIDSGFAVVQESEMGKSSTRRAQLTDDDITAQLVAFYFAGFDNTASLLSYISYELALNPDIQNRLRDEINSAAENHGKITYEDLLGMKYLDCVVSETLRRWASGSFTDRVSVRDYVIEPTRPGEIPLKIEAGTAIWFPTVAMHKDSEYFPNPTKFDPERFNDENKRNIKPFTYLPFGSGPRNCIGSRFGLLQAKLTTAKLLQRFEVVPVNKTKVPIEYSKKNLFGFPEEGIWLGFKSVRSS